MDNQKHIKRIQSSAAISLWCSVALVILTALFYFAANYRFYASNYTARWMLVAESALAVLAVAMVLLSVRRQVPALRQAEGLDLKLQGYAQMVQTNSYGLLVVVAVLCAVIVLTNQNVLFMLAMVVTMVLFLSYPNIYRIKNDLGLTDEQMRALFGSKYIADND